MKERDVVTGGFVIRREKNELTVTNPDVRNNRPGELGVSLFRRQAAKLGLLIYENTPHRFSRQTDFLGWDFAGRVMLFESFTHIAICLYS